MADVDEHEGDDGGYESAHGSVGTNVSEAPNQGDYLWLGTEHCRTLMSVKVGQVSVRVVCPRLAESCGYHHRQREAGTVEAEGAYLRFTPPRGRMVYGSAENDRLDQQAYDALGRPAPSAGGSVAPTGKIVCTPG